MQGTTEQVRGKFPQLISALETNGAKALEEFFDFVKVTGHRSESRNNFAFSIAPPCGTDRAPLGSMLYVQHKPFHPWNHPKCNISSFCINGVFFVYWSKFLWKNTANIHICNTSIEDVFFSLPHLHRRLFVVLIRLNYELNAVVLMRRNLW